MPDDREARIKRLLSEIEADGHKAMLVVWREDADGAFEIRFRAEDGTTEADIRSAVGHLAYKFATFGDRVRIDFDAPIPALPPPQQP